MGIKRIVDVELWKDEKVELYTPEEKYFWLFLLTNPNTTQLGIYHITFKQMSFYLGYDIETCKKLIERFETKYKVIKYVDSELAIKNYLKFSIIKGGKPVEDCLVKEIKNTKHKELIDWVFKGIDIDTCNETIKKVHSLYINNIYINDNENEDTLTYRSTYRSTYRKEDKLPTYDTSKNENIDRSEAKEILKLMGKDKK